MIEIKTLAKKFPKFQSYMSHHIWKCLNFARKFKIWRPALKVNMVASYSLHLRWRVVYLLVQGFTVDHVARLLHVEQTFVRKIGNIYRNTKTVVYRSRPGRVKKLEGKCDLK